MDADAIIARVLVGAHADNADGVVPGVLVRGVFTQMTQIFAEAVVPGVLVGRGVFTQISQMDADGVVPGVLVGAHVDFADGMLLMAF